MKRGKSIIGGVIAVALACAGWAASAQQVIVSGKATDLSQQQQALKEARAQAERARKRSETMETKAEQTVAEADSLNARAAALAARIQQSEADMRAGQARIAIINKMIANQQSHLASQQEPLIKLTAALQSLSRRPPMLSLLQPGSIKNAIHARAAFSQVLPVIQKRTATMRQDLDKARQLKAMSIRANAALKDSQTKLGEQRVALRRLEAQKRIAARGLASNAGLEAERATALSEQARDIDELLDELENAGDIHARLSSLPGPQLRPAAPGETRAPASTQASSAQTKSPAYRLPVVGAIITGLGEISDSGVRSRGITVATQPGAQLVAPAGGRIAFAGPYRGYGQIIIIDHGNGWSSLLANLSRLSVTTGDDVTQGAPVGLATTGKDPTITIELRRQGRPVDIIAMMNAND